MYRNILRKLNFGIFLLIAVIVTIAQTTLFSYFPLNFIQPDFLLIIAVYFGFRRSLFEGGAFVILTSMVAESHSGTGNHFFLTTYLYSFLIAKILSRTVVVPDFFSSILIVAGLTLFKKLGILVLLGTYNHAINGLYNFLIYLIPGLLVQAALTPMSFGWFMNIDLKTYKDEHAEDEYDINKGL